MKKNILILLSFICFLTACNDKETIVEQTEESSSKKELNLNGIWHLRKTTAPKTQKVFTYAKEEVIWTFNSNNKTIEVTEAIVNDSNCTTPDCKRFNFSGLQTGQYKYSIKTDEFGTYLYVDAVNLGMIKLQDENLQLDLSYLDGMLKEFTR